MKNLFIALTLILMTGPLVFATGKSPVTKKPSNTDFVKEAMVYPGFAIEEGIEWTVWMRLQVGADGKIEVIKASSTSNELLRYAVDKMETLTISEDKDYSCNPFNIKIDFILL